MPARRRGQTWTSFPGSVTCGAQASHHFQTFHFPAHEHHCYRIVKSSCIHCPLRACAQSDIQLLNINHYWYHGISCAPGGYFLCLMLSPSRPQASTRSSAHPPSSSTADEVVLFPRGGRFTRAKRPTFLSLMKLTKTIGHEGCEGIVS
jgi:hypothetical protein